MTKDEYDVIFFDGVCNFCNGAVNFIIRHDSRSRFKFASLQSRCGEQFLDRHPHLKKVDSIILLEGGKTYTHSSAALRIAGKMDGIIKAAALLFIVPKPFRDYLYNILAKNRYKWFGKRETCRIPTKEERTRFL
ncbi:thiol-disulfide oxidoreductase DCC family protein [Bacillus sp. MUM 13]|uniref:thiol-disulfide oxidoreductase DCC family protein n=1 Tax=Bacillus sp. MUM 13 TaxID=1678001 RepID=UPI0008F59772|nr:thiol-disulfide oxidoreductase DCC family protein [Bacillus sp. MUM 13]OIK14758.1 thiol-disulfide oxidoreductase [Bacillus sp. MUM 13]